MSTRLTWSVLASPLSRSILSPQKKSQEHWGRTLPTSVPPEITGMGNSYLKKEKRRSKQLQVLCSLGPRYFHQHPPFGFPKEMSWRNILGKLHGSTPENWRMTMENQPFEDVFPSNCLFDVPLPCSFSGGKKKCGNIFREKKQTSPTTFRCNPVKSLEGSNLMQLYLEWMINSNLRKMLVSIKNWMGPYQRTPKQVTRVMRYSGLGVRSLGPVGDFLDGMVILKDFPLYGLVWYCHEVLTKPQNLKSLIFPYMNFWRGRSPI